MVELVDLLVFLFHGFGHFFSRVVCVIIVTRGMTRKGLKKVNIKQNDSYSLSHVLLHLVRIVYFPAVNTGELVKYLTKRPVGGADALPITSSLLANLR